MCTYNSHESTTRERSVLLGREVDSVLETGSRLAAALY